MTTPPPSDSRTTLLTTLAQMVDALTAADIQLADPEIGYAMLVLGLGALKMDGDAAKRIPQLIVSADDAANELLITLLHRLEGDATNG